MLAALQPQLGAVEEHAVGHLDAPVLELVDDPPRALGLLELELERAVVTRVALDPLYLRQLLHAVLSLARLRCLRTKALYERLHARDLGLLLLDRPAKRHLARRLLLAPVGPRPGEEPRAACLHLEHRRADRLEEPAVVGDEHDRGVEADERL